MDVEDQLGDLVDDADFQTIVRSRSSFNLFEAVGAIRGELRHSNFLSFLLSPARNHGLGAQPLVRVLRAVLAKMPREHRPLTGLELIVSDLDGAIVDREMHNIDLLIEIKQLNLLILIENKIDSKAGDGQLARYRAAVENRYPDHRRLLVFLTPDGTPPGEQGYVAFSYTEMAKVLETVAEGAAPNIAMVVLHYVEMLRRHIVPDEKLRELARQLSERHKEAFDFVDECKPQAQGMIGIVRDIYEADSPGLVKVGDTSTYLRFVPQEWTTPPLLNACPLQDWTKSGRNLLFEVKTFSNESYASRILLALIAGPADQSIRTKLYDGVKARPETFIGLVKPMGAKWATIFARELLGAAAGKDQTVEERAIAINASWAQFLANDLPKLKVCVAEIIAET